MNYRKLQLYSILLLSVFFQSFLNLYDTYIECKERTRYQTSLISRDRFKLNSSANNGLPFVRTREDNFYIPKQAQAVRRYLKNSPVDSFRLSPSLLNTFDRYAILEGAYPIRFSDKSHYLIASCVDILPKNCNVLHSTEVIQLAYCP